MSCQDMVVSGAHIEAKLTRVSAAVILRNLDGCLLYTSDAADE